MFGHKELTSTEELWLKLCMYLVITTMIDHPSYKQGIWKWFVNNNIIYCWCIFYYVYHITLCTRTLQP